jgi:hypothetical protein
MIYINDVMRIIRERFKRQIHRKQREANALSIEVGLEAEKEHDVVTLAETALALDASIEVLSEAKAKLKESDGTAS